MPKPPGQFCRRKIPAQATALSKYGSASPLLGGEDTRASHRSVHRHFILLDYITPNIPVSVVLTMIRDNVAADELDRRRDARQEMNMHSALGGLLTVVLFLACTTFFGANVLAFQAQKTARPAVEISGR